MASQPKGISPEGVSFDDLGASLQIFVMQPTNQVGLGDVQFVVAAINENPFGVEQRAHRAIAQDRGCF